MANHRSSFPVPCYCRVTEYCELCSNSDEDFELNAGEIVLVKNFDPINNCYICKRIVPVTGETIVFTIEDDILEYAGE